MSETYVPLRVGGRVIGRVLQSDGSGLPSIRKSYPWADFLDALEDPELDAFLALKATAPAGLMRFLARIEARGSIDFNGQKPQQFLTYLVNQNVLTAQRALELRG